MENRIMKKLALYIHFPFCKQKCYYCDFKSFANKEMYVDSYIEALCKEIEMYNYLKDEYEGTSIYLGGGTPSYIDSKHISKVLGFVRNNYIVNKDAEITIEINPGTVNKNKLQDYYKAGINRISFGVQSTDNLTEVTKEIVKVANKQKLKTVEVTETIKFIKNNNEWKIEL